jgi:hypothetical protein
MEIGSPISLRHASPNPLPRLFGPSLMDSSQPALRRSKSTDIGVVRFPRGTGRGGLKLEDNQWVRVEGKFLFAGSQKLDVKGVTYGPFRPTEFPWHANAD